MPSRDTWQDFLLLVRSAHGDVVCRYIGDNTPPGTPEQRREAGQALLGKWIREQQDRLYKMETPRQHS